MFLLECKIEKGNSQCEHGQRMEQTRGFVVLHVRIRCGMLSITTPVLLLANEFDIRSILHEHVSLAAVNHSNVFHEVMNGCKLLKIH